MQQPLPMHVMLVTQSSQADKTERLPEKNEVAWPVWPGGSPGHGGATKVPQAIQQADTCL